MLFSLRSAAVDSLVTLRYKHPLEWTASYNASSRQATVRRPSGSAITFGAREGSDDAAPTGASRKLSYRMQLLNEDLTPNTSGSPSYLNMCLPDGTALRFSVATGRVAALISAEGVETSAEEYESQWRINRNPLTGNIESIWSASEGLLKAVSAGNRLILEWYAPENVVRTGEKFDAEGTPIKTYVYEKTERNGVSSMKITQQSPGRAPFVTERLQQGDNITVITGEGPERIIRTIERNFLPGGKWETIDTTRREGDAEPSSCVRIVKKNTPGGWLDLSRTEGYGSPAAQTTLNTYNDQYRVALQILPDGGYTRFEYDDRGRIVLEASPWAGGGEKVLRTVYADLRFNDFRPASETELLLDENGVETVLRTKTYSYQDDAETSRTTIVETALGSSETRTSVRETYGPAAPCTYARGRVKTVQTPDGILKTYEYATETAYNAAYSVTITQTANGTVVPGQSTRSIAYIRADGLIACEEQYAHTGGNFSLLSREIYDYDAEGHKCRTTLANGRIRTTEWMCTAPLRETNEDGIVTTYGYDSARHLVETIRSATETTPETITSMTTDAAGRTLGVRVDAGAMTTQTRVSYDILGRVVSETDVLGRTTTKDYADDGRTETVATPTGATLIATKDFDGSLLALDGTGQQAKRFVYELCEAGVRRTTLVKDGDAWTPSERVTVNGFEETVLEERANSLGGFIVTKKTYDAAGRETSVQKGRLAPTVSTYDALGNLKQTVVVLDPENPESPLTNRVTKRSVRYEQKEDGVYQTRSETVYNAEGEELTSVTSTLVSQLDGVVAAQTVSTNIFGKESRTRTEYGMGPERFFHASNSLMEHSSLRREVDGFTVEETDFFGLKRKWKRTYTQQGVVYDETDPRGNMTTIETDIAGREVARTNAAGNATLTGYGACHDLPVAVTDPLGGQTHAAYDLRGRRTAQWGSNTQPLLMEYDDANRVIAMTTFRAAGETIASDPSGRTDGDVTRWQYHAASGLPLAKILPDGSEARTTYDAENRVTTGVNARGIVTTYAYAEATGELLSVSYGDNTPQYQFAYNHLGQKTSVSDAAGPRAYTYDRYGILASETSESVLSLQLDYKTDAFARDAGYKLTVDGHVFADVTHAFDADSRLASASIRGLEDPFQWSYDKTSGFVKELSYPNPLVRKDTYMPKRDLVAKIDYWRPNSTNSPVKHEYEYDRLMRPTQRRDTWNTPAPKTTRLFTHNERGELTGDQLRPGGRFGYQYDNIGNRRDAFEFGNACDYESNAQNQYERIVASGQDFCPEYDADGNQTLIRTTTGIWKATYDAENRPCLFEKQNEPVRIECVYDHMGRRTAKAVWRDGVLKSRRVFLYKDTLLIAEVDAMPMTEGQSPAILHTWFWDPAQPYATRPLMMTRWKKPADAAAPSILENLFYTHDDQTNVSALFGIQGGRRALYEYRPFGGIITQQGDVAALNPFRFSSEYMDDDLGLIAYLYRYLNPKDGRWITRDPIAENGGMNLYAFIANRIGVDLLGLSSVSNSPYFPLTYPTPHYPPMLPGGKAGGDLTGTINVDVTNGNEQASIIFGITGKTEISWNAVYPAANKSTVGIDFEIGKGTYSSGHTGFSISDLENLRNCCYVLGGKWKLGDEFTLSLDAKAQLQEGNLWSFPANLSLSAPKDFMVKPVVTLSNENVMRSRCKDYGVNISAQLFKLNGEKSTTTLSVMMSQVTGVNPTLGLATKISLQNGRLSLFMNVSGDIKDLRKVTGSAGVHYEF